MISAPLPGRGLNGEVREGEAGPLQRAFGK